jgi:hypothetical protein
VREELAATRARIEHLAPHAPRATDDRADTREASRPEESP